MTEKDDLSLLGGLGTTDRAKLNSKGLFTVTQLAYTFRPRRRPSTWHRVENDITMLSKRWQFETGKIHVVGTPKFAVTGTPVYLDVEGLPDLGFYYLIGLRLPEDLRFFNTASGPMIGSTRRRSGGPFLISCSASTVQS